MINEEFVDFLVCPLTKQTLNIADNALSLKLNQAIESKSLKNNSGQLVTEKIDTLLIREDKQLAYIVRNNIPVMIVEEAINLNDI